MIIKRKNYFILILLCFSLFAYPSSMIVKLSDLHTMANNSDIIMHGYVGDQSVITDKLGRLITLTQLEVLDNIHGAKTGDIVTIYQVGGQKDGLVMPLLGGHQYAFGQELIFFGLKLADTYVGYGAGQGKFDIKREGDNQLITEDLGNIHAVNYNNSDKLEIYTPTPMSFNDVDLLKQEIKMMIDFRK